ncbi:MAG: hypothetical protein K6G68_04295 [Oscillospiraceae bacterium]|nr:hypothetical protein [Oscillospiraceae bacterium]
MIKIRKYIDLVLSIMFIGSVILGYYDHIPCMGEYCFISGMATGIVFFASFLSQHRNGKPLPTAIYLACAANIFIIFAATAAMGLNLEGAFIVIHILDPLLILAYWFVFCDSRTVKRRYTLSVLAFPMAYMVFALILFMASGDCPFPARLIFVDSSAVRSAIVCVCVMAGLCAEGALIFMLNRLIRKKERFNALCA